MKRIFLSFVALLMFTGAFSQAKKPTIMVLPSDAWCIQHGFKTTVDNNGTKLTVPDYTAAVQNDMDLLQVIAKLNDLMADRGFPLKNLESELKSIVQNNAEMMAIQSSNGAEVQTSLYDQLRNTAKADIIMQITWDIVKQGPQKSIRYTLQGLDSYTNKQIAGASGTGTPSFSASVPVLLEEAVHANMDAFCERLMTHFDDMVKNGREISIILRVFNNSAVNFESEVGGKEVSEIIEDWFNANTVNHRFTVGDLTQNVMRIEQVRIPLYDQNNRAMDANRFARNLSKYLRGAPCNIPAIKLLNQGLGKCTLILGDK